MPIALYIGTVCLSAAGCGFVLLALLLTLATRFKKGKWWRNTVIWRLCRWCRRLWKRCWRAVTEMVRTLPMTWRAILGVLGVLTGQSVLVLLFFESNGSFFIFLLTAVLDAALVAGAASIAANIALCLALTERFSVAGLALASALSPTVYALLLLLPLQRRDRLLDGRSLRELGKMALAAAAMGLCVSAALGALSPLLPAGKMGELLCLGTCVLVGAGLYFALTWILGVEEAKLCISAVKNTLKRG